MKQETQKSSCAIPADIFRRIFLYTIIGEFADGVYGAKRLQKIAYLAERGRGIIKPFTYKKYYYGQYSEQVQDTNEQLLSLGFVKAFPLNAIRKTTITIDDDTYESIEQGNGYKISDQQMLRTCESIVIKTQPRLMQATKEAIRDHGYKKEEDLIDYCYRLKEFKDKDDEEVIFESNLPKWVETPDLSNDKRDELILSLTPSFIDFANKIVEGFEKTTINWNKVAKVVLKV
ncbi:MAG TPA: hypothetical protein VMV76_07920 [Dehalococcoidia bacterium]|nr:hypothetical protein [Dehalococcoidia bacterium]